MRIFGVTIRLERSADVGAVVVAVVVVVVVVAAVAETIKQVNQF